MSDLIDLTIIQKKRKVDKTGCIPGLSMLMLSVCLMQYGCVSILYEDGTGQLRVIGLAWTQKTIGSHAMTYHVIAPGLSFRLCSYEPGLALGWHESTLLFPPHHLKPSCSPVAFETALYGLAFSTSYVAIGYNRQFGIPFPSDASVVQAVFYSSRDPLDSFVSYEDGP